MKLDIKDQILLAIYKEYNQELPDIHGKIKPEFLGIEPELFYYALDKLQNESMISGVTIKRAYKSQKPIGVVSIHMVITPLGINYTEKMLQIEKGSTKSEKMKSMAKRIGEWSLEQGKDITAKTLAYLLEDIMIPKRQ